MAVFGAPGLRFEPGEAGRLTIWNVFGIWLGMAAYAAAWTWGGRPERFAAGVLLACCLSSFITYKWEIGGFHLAGFAENCVRLLIFTWLCLRADRWWPLVMTAAIGLIVLVDVLALVDPDVSELESMSAQVGLGYLVDLSLLLSIFERWLAGEAPAARTAWAAADIATAARRGRKDEARPGGSVSPAAGSRKAVLRQTQFGPRGFRLMLSRIAEKG